MNDTVDFHTANTMLNQHSDVCYPLVVRFFIIGQCSVAWLLLGLEDAHTRQCEPLKPTILSKHAPFWQAILGFSRDPFIMHFPCIRGAQEPYAPVRIHNHHIFAGMVFLLATVVDFLFISVFRPCYRSFRAIMAKKGGASGSPGADSARSWAASSAAVRAGRRCWRAKATFRMSSNRRTHVLTFA